jgi:hypothetical protein
MESDGEEVVRKTCGKGAEQRDGISGFPRCLGWPKGRLDEALRLPVEAAGAILTPGFLLPSLDVLGSVGMMTLRIRAASSSLSGTGRRNARLA